MLDLHGKSAYVVSTNGERYDRLCHLLTQEGWAVDGCYTGEENLFAGDINGDSLLLRGLDGELPLANELTSRQLAVVDLSVGEHKWLMNYAMAIRHQIPNLPVVALTTGRMVHHFVDGLGEIGIHVYSYGRDLLWDVMPKAGKRVVRDIGYPIHHDKSKEVAFYAYAPMMRNYPLPQVPPGDLAWIKPEPSIFYSWLWLKADDPHLDLPLNGIWTECDAKDNGDLGRLATQYRTVLPEDRHASKEAYHEWCAIWQRRILEAVSLLSDNSREHALYKVYGIDALDLSNDTRHLLSHALVRRALPLEEIMSFFPAITVALNRMMFMQQRGEFKEDLWVGYRLGMSPEEIIALATTNIRTWKHWHDCPLDL